MFYTRLCDPNYIASRVHYYVGKHLQEAAFGKCPRLIINMPVRHGKSRLVAVELATWYLGHFPHKAVVYGSYGDTLCYKHGRQSRDRVNSPFYQQIFPDAKPDPRSQAVMDWRTTQGGGYYAVTVKGQLTGKDCNLLLLDDLHRDFAEAHSEVVRERVWEWFLSVAYSRMPEAIVLIGTRWHVDDISGRLMDPARQSQMEDAGAPEEVWKVINLPAIAEDNDILGRPNGAALFPEKYPLQRLKAIREVEGSYKWSAMFMGEPVPRGGNYINSADFQIKTADEIPVEVCRWVRFWDLATSEKEKDDFTASCLGAFDKDGNLWIKDMIVGQWEWPKAREKIRQTIMAEMKYVKIVGVEAVAGFKTAFQNLKEVVPYNIMLCEWGAEKDKLTRALPWIALTENKKVFLVQGEWITSFCSQCEAFPAGKNDDMVDAVSGIYSMLKSHIGFAPIVSGDRYDTAIAYRRNRSLSG